MILACARTLLYCHRMPLGPFGTVTPDSPPTLRPGVQNADAHYHLDTKVPPEHPERAAKGDLSMVHVPDMPSRVSFQGQPAPVMKSWDGSNDPGHAPAPFELGVKKATSADTSAVPSDVKFQAGLPVTLRVERRRK